MSAPVAKPAWLHLTAALSIGILIGAVSAVQVAPRIQTTELANVGGPATGEDSFDSMDPTSPDALPTSLDGPLREDQQGNVVNPPPPGIACARGRNGGSTDKGITADKIKLATTTVQSGNGASFLGEVKFAIEALQNKVNREGGICGRTLDIQFVDDAWDAARGQNAIRNFINSDVFAIAVGPSSEGVQAAIKSGDIDKAGIPLVGADGMVINQYESDWVWPVAVATVSAARIMARNAFKKGARDFSIVFDRDYKFGQEAAQAYNNEVKRLTGADVPGYNPTNSCKQSFCGIKQGESSYASEVFSFKPGEFVAMFLEPGTAQTWMSTANVPKPSSVRYGIGAAQPMFTRDFANNCQSACHKMWIWSGYRPADPSSPYASEPAVRTYVGDLQKTKTNADIANAFTAGGYVGMLLLVEALKKLGPYVTRAGLAAELNKITLRSGLTIQKELRWSPTDRYANTTMQAFEIEYAGTFGGWRAKDILRDTTPEFGIN